MPGPHKSLEYDRAEFHFFGSIQRHPEDEAQWSLKTKHFLVKMDVHPTLREQLEQNPEQYAQRRLVKGWMRWNPEKGKLRLMAVSSLKPTEKHKAWTQRVKGNYQVQGYITDIKGPIALVRITPRRAQIEPFELPIIQPERMVGKVQVGSYIYAACYAHNGWLNVKYWRDHSRYKAEQQAAA